MSLYHEAADLLAAPNTLGGSLKSRIFGSNSVRSPPAQIYALVIETCKWSAILKEVVENAGLLGLERKFTPVLSLLLVHDLLLAKKGIALSASHGLRTAVERHKARLQAELTKARLVRKLGSMEALKQFVDSGKEGSSGSESLYPRWIRINTLKSQLEDRLETTFADYKRVGAIDAVRQRESRCVYVDVHIPNLIAVPSFVDITRSEAYTTGSIVFQDKASCFPAYLLDPLPEDGDIIDTCAAPGNKTTHLAAIMASHAPEIDDHAHTIHAFERDKARAETLKKMVASAGCEGFTIIHAAQDFLKTDPHATEYRNVGALLLDPSCSGSGIIGRDEMPTLHLPSLNSTSNASTTKNKSKIQSSPVPSKGLKRKRHTTSPSSPPHDSFDLDIAEDQPTLPPLSDPQDLQTRLTLLSAFQLSLVLHAMRFPSAHKIAYSTCSTYAAENEHVVIKALTSPIARERGWRILRRDEQVRGMREWDVRGEKGGDEEGELGEGGWGGLEKDVVTEACIRANKDDGRGTMGFFVAGFVRERGRGGGSGIGGGYEEEERASRVRRDERGFIVRDLLGMPIVGPEENEDEDEDGNGIEEQGEGVEEEEWNGFEDNDGDVDIGEDAGERQDNVVPIRMEESQEDVPAKDIADTNDGSKKRKQKRKTRH